MRIVLFYSEVESFNYFSNQIKKELEQRGHETFLLDLRKTEAGKKSFGDFLQFAEKKIDMAIAYDGIGIKDDLYIELWNSYATLAVNILMDHPLRFHPSMEKHPKNYVQFCCDRNHVAYVKKYFAQQVERVEFMPHAGTPVQDSLCVPYEDKKYDILFSGTYYPPEIKLQELDADFAPHSTMNVFYRKLADYMITNTGVPTELAVQNVMQQMGLPVKKEQMKMIFAMTETIDWYARMWARGLVVQTLADAGFEVWLLGRGWENHASVNLKNVHRIDDRIPFSETLPYMANARINLNVMPWFKDGTHDRIFNTLLWHSLPLTDKSDWLTEQFTDGQDIAFFELDELQKLPEKVADLLKNPGKTQKMIERGYQKVRENYTWKNCVDQIMQYAGD